MSMVNNSKALRKDLVRRVIAILVPLLVGILGQLVTGNAVSTWYLSIAKPAWTPPSWLFGPVWTLLYVLMGVSFYLVWKIGFEHTVPFFVQLTLNAVWSPLFFGFKSPRLALVDIVLLDIVVVWTIYRFAQQDRKAAVLLVPYLCWILFATALNGAIVLLN